AVGAGDDLNIRSQIASERARSSHFFSDDVHLRRPQLSRRSAVAANRELRPAGNLDGQGAGSNHAGDFGIAKLLEQDDDIAIERLFRASTWRSISTGRTTRQPLSASRRAN